MANKTIKHKGKIVARRQPNYVWSVTLPDGKFQQCVYEEDAQAVVDKVYSTKK